MLTRLISGILLLIILAFAMSNGGSVLYALTLFISLVGFSELVKATNVRKEEKKPSGIEIVGYLGIVAYYIVRYLTDSDTYALLAIMHSRLCQQAFRSCIVRCFCPIFI